ncbi:MAG: hypothetical protein GYA62_16360 [Bacteroidales bacterium]|jgi:hypothetical protein|nr:hypothetical protein [Bacteroidales bacterium]
MQVNPNRSKLFNCGFCGIIPISNKNRKKIRIEANDVKIDVNQLKINVFFAKILNNAIVKISTTLKYRFLGKAKSKFVGTNHWSIKPDVITADKNIKVNLK